MQESFPPGPDTIRVIVADDEPLARQLIRVYLEQEKDIELVAECQSGREAIAVILDSEPDLVFLDVEMPGGDGFEVVNTVGSERIPLVVFVTAHDRFAIRAFDASALDYLTKPFDESRFRKTLDRARAHLRQKRWLHLNSRIETLLTELQKPKYPDRIPIRSAGQTMLLRAAEIDWIGSKANYVRLHVGRDSYLLRESVAGIEAKLNPDQFMRIHRTTIVNVDRIKEIQSRSLTEQVLVLQDGTKLSISRGYRLRVRNQLGLL